MPSSVYDPELQEFKAAESETDANHNPEEAAGDTTVTAVSAAVTAAAAIGSSNAAPTNITAASTAATTVQALDAVVALAN